MSKIKFIVKKYLGRWGLYKGDLLLKAYESLEAADAAAALLNGTSNAIEAQIAMAESGISFKIGTPESLAGVDTTKRYLWLTQPGATETGPCPECEALDNRTYPDEINETPPLHPRCVCMLVELSAEEAEARPPEGRSVTNIVHREAGAVRAVLEGEIRRLEVLIAPFGSASHRDRLNQWLDDKTDYMLAVGDSRPVLYMHKPIVTGRGVHTRQDELGKWAAIELNDSPWADRQWRAALAGRAVASTGSINYLAEPARDVPGHVTRWPIAEISIFDRQDGTPVSDDAVVMPIRSFYDELNIAMPEAFEAGEDKDNPGGSGVYPSDDKSATRSLTVTEKTVAELVAEALAAEKELTAAKEAERAAMRASIVAELGQDPKYRGVFNVAKPDPTKGEDAGKQETYRFMRNLVQDAKRVLEGGLPIHYAAPDAKRGLEESEAAEIGSLVPDDLYAGISESRGKYSLVRKSGMFTYTTDKLTFTVPTVTTDMTITPTVAEEGAYVEIVPAVAAKTATMLKKGAQLVVSEESLEDIPLLTQWLSREAGRSMALAENLVLYALLATIDAANEIATTKVILDSEILRLYYELAQEYRDEAVWLANDATIAYIRAMLVATPRAYGEIGFEYLRMGDVPGEFFMGHRLFTNSNWTPISTTTQDDLPVLTFSNLSESVAWVDRRGLSIFIDPFTLRAAAGQVQILPSARFNGVVLRSTAQASLDGHES